VRNYLCRKGKYTVSQVLEDGIIVSSQYGGHEFLYMGPVMVSPVLETITRSPHKITLINKGANNVN
jgi:hypothetical protein